MSAGRPKTFDEQQVLESAMELFWLRGYAGLGMSELLQHMGISRQSLYDTFGNKRALFIRTIEHYRATRLTKALALLEGEGSRVESVKAVVRFFKELAQDERCRGCLVANSLVELGPHDEPIAALLQETLDLLQGAVARALREAQERGELSRTRSADQLSRALTNAMIGLAVTGRLRVGRGVLEDICSGTLSMLD